MNPSQMIFNFFCPDLSEESLSMTLKPYGRYFLNNKTWKVLIHELQNGYCIHRHENNINLIVSLQQSFLVTKCIVGEQ